jgi:hypothetical protein
VDDARTGSPGAFATGTLSPVTGAWFTLDVPTSTSPSVGMDCPGFTRNTSPARTSSTGISVSRGAPFSSRRTSAVLGAKSMSAFTAARVFSPV